MTTSPPVPEEEDRDMLAASHALGVLAGVEKAGAERLVRTDPAFGRRVDLWRERLSLLADAVPAERPDPAVWHRVEAGLDEHSDIIPLMPRLHRAAERRARPVFWQSWAGLATAVAAALAFVLVTRPEPVVPAQQFAAVLETPGAPGAGWLVTVDTASAQVFLVPLGAAPAAPDRSRELWVIAGEGASPRSLGVMDAAARFAIPAEAMQGGTTLAVSLEPRGGSPTGAPTGPVVYAGTLRALPAPR